jgi:hypothetical protein
MCVEHRRGLAKHTYNIICIKVGVGAEVG